MASLERLRQARLCYFLAKAYINSLIDGFETREVRDYAIAGLVKEVNAAAGLLGNDRNWGPAARQITQTVQQLRSVYEKTGVLNEQELNVVKSLLDNVLSSLASALN